MSAGRQIPRPFRMFVGALNFEIPDPVERDTAEKVYISTLALLKMLKHASAGVPVAVIGLMLGEFVDDFKVRVVDVFSMPQTATGVSVEASDLTYQVKMIDMLKQTGRSEIIVGWYRSNPGFGCWLSEVDINTQESFENVNQQAIAIVIDPVKKFGKVSIGAFRAITHMWDEPRQTTSNFGLLHKPSPQALKHGLNRLYYALNIEHEKKDLADEMLASIYEDDWSKGFDLKPFDKLSQANEESVLKMLKLSTSYLKAIKEESKCPRGQLEEEASTMMAPNIIQTLGMMLNGVCFSSDIDTE